MKNNKVTALVSIILLVLLAACDQPPQLTKLPGTSDELCAGTGGTPMVFTSTDGAELGFVAYRQQDKPASTALIYLHGIESHAGWFDCAARMLRDKGYDVFCLDRRGSGINRENRNFTSGHISNFEILIADINAFLQQKSSDYKHIFLVGLSWGGKLAYTYNLIHPDDFDGLILITPGLVSKVDVNLSTKLGIFSASLIKPTTGFDLPIATEMFTTTPRYYEWIKNDPLRNHQASAKFLMESNRMDGFIKKNGHRSRAPILLFLAGNDKIIDNEAVLTLLQDSPDNNLSLVSYQEQTHSIQFDAPEKLTADMDSWLQHHFLHQEVARE
ncbi:MAG: alpha/beta fold hydrolase [Thermodesulfobacteriota bacterium]|nr:alpha/beta fold hydrolase [Thermodesulfobacteriota bacterium]